MTASSLLIWTIAAVITVATGLTWTVLIPALLSDAFINPPSRCSYGSQRSHD
jgi:hypothetical protein